MLAYVCGDFRVDFVPVGLQLFHLAPVSGAVFIELLDIGIGLLYILVDLVFLGAQLLCRGLYVLLAGNQRFLLCL